MNPESPRRIPDEPARGGASIAPVLAVWGLLALPSFALLGAVLDAHTHHHALAGVTFAVAALVVGAALAIVAARVVGLVRGHLARRRAGPPR